MVTHHYYPWPGKFFFFVYVYVPIDEIKINIGFNVDKSAVIESDVRIRRLEIVCYVVAEILACSN